MTFLSIMLESCRHEQQFSLEAGFDLLTRAHFCITHIIKHDLKKMDFFFLGSDHAD